MIVKCSKCNVEFDKYQSQIEKSKSGNHFCSRSCSNSYNNSVSPKRKLVKKFCNQCGKEIDRKSFSNQRVRCEDCSIQNVDWSTVTYAEVKGQRKYQKNSRIRALARQTYIKSGRPQCCEKCGYDKHFEVCHIKAIKDHTDDTLVSEINDLSNLLALCPNCHWELDYGDV